jgi:hypothetical protein
MNLTTGFTDDEVDAARNGFLQQRQVTRSPDRILSRNLAFYFSLGRTFEWDANQEARIQPLIAEDVNEACAGRFGMRTSRSSGWGFRETGESVGTSRCSLPSDGDRRQTALL